jgi:hypothetical protein
MVVPVNQGRGAEPSDNLITVDWSRLGEIARTQWFHTGSSGYVG